MNKIISRLGSSCVIPKFGICHNAGSWTCQSPTTQRGFQPRGPAPSSAGRPPAAQPPLTLYAGSHLFILLPEFLSIFQEVTSRSPELTFSPLMFPFYFFFFSAFIPLAQLFSICSGLPAEHLAEQLTANHGGSTDSVLIKR